MRVTSNSPYIKEEILSLRDLLEEKTGIYLSEEKLDRLEEAFRDAGDGLTTTSVPQVIQAIRLGSDEGKVYLNQLVASIATNETYFFRITPHFAALKKYLLPELFQVKSSHGNKTLRIWSAGCSTGEEPYSLAILLLETFPDIHAREITILATDIDLDALQKAQQGTYRPWSFRGVEGHIIQKYFHVEKGGVYRVHESIRSLVTFRSLNLKSDPYPFPLNGTTDLDIILCRNVTIYFRPDTIREVIGGFYACLNEGGFLFTGTAEYFPQMYHDFEVRVFPDSVVYQKPFQKRSLPLKLAFPPLPVRKSCQPAADKAKIKRPSDATVETDPLGQALGLISQGEVDKALVLLATHAEKDPSDSRVCFLLGQVAADRHHLSEALHWLSRTLVLNPLHLWAHYLLGLIGLDEGKIEEAAQSFKKAIYIDSSFALGHFYLGRIYKGQGYLEKAHKSFATVKGLLHSAAPSEALPCTEGMTAKQLLALVNEELTREG